MCVWGGGWVCVCVGVCVCVWWGWGYGCVCGGVVVWVCGVWGWVWGCVCVCVFFVLFCFKGVLHLWTLFLKTLCIFSKNKANLDNVSCGSGQKCSKELKNHTFTSVEAIVRKLERKMCENQYFPCFEP